MRQLIAATQKTGSSSTDPNIAYTHWMQDIARNPDYADQQAKE